jgi:hypothetical protein
MEHHILPCHGFIQTLRIQKIGLHKTEIGFSHALCQVLSLSGGKVIQNGYIMLLQQPLQQMAADKSRPTGY